MSRLINWIIMGLLGVFFSTSKTINEVSYNPVWYQELVYKIFNPVYRILEKAKEKMNQM